MFQLENCVFMRFSLQCKVYKERETIHASWGQQLSSIEMDFKHEAGSSYVTIDKEKYL